MINLIIALCCSVTASLLLYAKYKAENTAILEAGQEIPIQPSDIESPIQVESYYSKIVSHADENLVNYNKAVEKEAEAIATAQNRLQELSNYIHDAEKNSPEMLIALYNKYKDEDLKNLVAFGYAIDSVKPGQRKSPLYAMLLHSIEEDIERYTKESAISEKAEFALRASLKHHLAKNVQNNPTKSP